MLTIDFVPGAPNWLDLGTPDVDAAAAFYRELFGWEFQSAGPDAGGYGFFRLGDRVVAAAGLLTEEGARSAWTLYFHTTDAQATTKAVEQAGGTVRFGPFDVFTAGRMAGFTDPTGADFAVWEPADVAGLEEVTAPGTLCWTELYTTDASAAKDFYRSVFSWDLRDVDFGPGYTLVTPSGGGQDAQHGGIMQLQPENLAAGTTSDWHPYFEVIDCDTTAARAAEHGATALIAPMDAENVGRLAMFTDPFGATFAVITSAMV
ncbi:MULTISPECIES: VOC family protein [Streptomycetaceae]|uniref:Glyoxalase/bleomycin resistance protein/dioxygenase n=1 Tax=Streptantibioticus cattleyicolor (strain ATCC 35852 / DSM 46488 / JCM 4925 / NBRC 14057 / NRRL 8057) TaxID=1003195 RepID=F8K2Y8_STREN|nr:MULTISPECIES: VOC family protein [Streptomycetaceae]AEW92476.1 glyoxalase/bleomycin resistance protein/dioxygenase [Streptantibioticus cattleyicolor NRRL 8057 = DSM 46488]MYS57280.1 VOC family protein [Streptomyces sp. SID5468]CCB72837.1 Glyoxalase/bleomycin resistance protein/dioxygenase [Streptantibioticus cattleyicolor NRRL 8057 = DSM 46488]